MILTIGSIVDVYYLFKTEKGIALTLDEKQSLENKEKALQMEISQNCSLLKLV